MGEVFRPIGWTKSDGYGTRFETGLGVSSADMRLDGWEPVYVLRSAPDEDEAEDYRRTEAAHRAVRPRA